MDAYGIHTTDHNTAATERNTTATMKNTQATEADAKLDGDDKIVGGEVPNHNANKDDSNPSTAAESTSAIPTSENTNQKKEHDGSENEEGSGAGAAVGAILKYGRVVLPFAVGAGNVFSGYQLNVSQRAREVFVVSDEGGCRLL